MGASVLKRSQEALRAETANQGGNRLNAITFPPYSCQRKGLGKEIRLYICCQGLKRPSGELHLNRTMIKQTCFNRHAS